MFQSRDDKITASVRRVEKNRVGGAILMLVIVVHWLLMHLGVEMCPTQLQVCLFWTSGVLPIVFNVSV